jgi:hypothetical protein
VTLHKHLALTETALLTDIARHDRLTRLVAARGRGRRVLSAQPERLTKLDVVQRQLRTAIRMFFEDGDSVSAYTLAAAVEGVPGGLRKKQGKAHPFRKAVFIKKGMEDQVNDLLNLSQNFFKHASSDPDEVHEFPAVALEYVLFQCVVLYQMYRPPQGVAFRHLVRPSSSGHFFGRAAGRVPRGAEDAGSDVRHRKEHVS